MTVSPTAIGTKTYTNQKSGVRTLVSGRVPLDGQGSWVMLSCCGVTLRRADVR